MSGIALLGSLTYYIQAYKIFVTKSAKDITLLGYLISTFTSINWLIYGWSIQDNPLISSGGISLVGALLVVTGIIKYR